MVLEPRARRRHTRRHAGSRRVVRFSLRTETLLVLSVHSHKLTALHSFETMSYTKIRMSVLASGSDHGSICIWNVKSGDCLQNILGHEKNILSLESIGTSRLASSSLDNTIRVWNVDLNCTSFVQTRLLWMTMFTFCKCHKQTSTSFIRPQE